MIVKQKSQQPKKKKTKTKTPVTTLFDPNTQHTTLKQLRKSLKQKQEEPRDSGKVLSNGEHSVNL